MRRTCSVPTFIGIHGSFLVGELVVGARLALTLARGRLVEPPRTVRALRRTLRYVTVRRKRSYWTLR